MQTPGSEGGEGSAPVSRAEIPQKHVEAMMEQKKRVRREQQRGTSVFVFSFLIVCF